MTIEDRVDDACYKLLDLEGAEFREAIRLALLEAMKDQRHACAEAIRYADTDLIFQQKSYLTKDKAHQVVINADVAEVK